MKKISFVVIFIMVFISGCASKPPMPPEPKGPLVKVNMDQPHIIFGGKK